MQAEFWEFAIPAITASTATIFTIWRTSRRTNQKVDEAKEYAKPTGNGFANEVREGLKLIQAEQNRQALHIARLEGVISAVIPQQRQEQ